MPPELFSAVADAPASGRRTAATVAVLIGVAALAVLPAGIAVGAAGRLTGPVAAWIGGLVAVVGGVKLAAVAWGLVVQTVERPRLRAGAASID